MDKQYKDVKVVFRPKDRYYPDNSEELKELYFRCLTESKCKELISTLLSISKLGIIHNIVID